MDFSKFKAVNKQSSNLIGTTGEYFVCGELSKRDVVAVLTPKKNNLFDIMASDQEGENFIAISVKTASIGNNDGWTLNIEYTRRKENSSLFVILVKLLAKNNDYYIYQFDELVDKLNSLKKNRVKDKQITNLKNKSKQRVWLSIRDVESSRRNDWSIITKKLNVIDFLTSN